jgi:integrase
MAKKNYSTPKLYPSNRDMDKIWFVSFRFFNPDTGKYKQFQYRGNLQNILSRAERIQEGKSMAQAYADLLAEGWNPFVKETDTVNKEAGLTKDKIGAFVERKKTAIRKTTYTAYRYVTRAFCEWLRKECRYDILLASVTRKHAQAYADYNIRRGLSAHACGNHISILSSVFNDFVDREIIPVNPFSKIKRPKTRDRENIAFTDTERNLIREHLRENNKRLYYAVQFVYYCMLRRTDLMHLRVGDIDFINKTIRTRGATSKNSRSQSVTIPKSFEKNIA